MRSVNDEILFAVLIMVTSSLRKTASYRGALKEQYRSRLVFKEKKNVQWSFQNSFLDSGTFPP